LHKIYGTSRVSEKELGRGMCGGNVMGIELSGDELLMIVDFGVEIERRLWSFSFSRLVKEPEISEFSSDSCDIFYKYSLLRTIGSRAGIQTFLIALDCFWLALFLLCPSLGLDETSS
jgi:hypothetical protein